MVVVKVRYVALCSKLDPKQRCRDEWKRKVDKKGIDGDGGSTAFQP